MDASVKYKRMQQNSQFRRLKTQIALQIWVGDAFLFSVLIQGRQGGFNANGNMHRVS